VKFLEEGDVLIVDIHEQMPEFFERPICDKCGTRMDELGGEWVCPWCTMLPPRCYVCDDVLQGEEKETGICSQCAEFQEGEKLFEHAREV
jgi:hypothetical protein